MSLTEKLDRKAYPILLAEIVLMAAAIQLNIFFGGGLTIKRLLAITIGIMLAIFLIEHFKLYIVTGIVVAMAAVVAVWQRDVVLPFIESNMLVRVLGFMVLAAIALYISQHFFVMRLGVCIGYWGAMIFLIHKDLFPIKQVMFFLVAELVFVIVELCDRIYYRNETRRNKKMFSLAPVVLILVLVLSALPYNREPLGWNRTKRFINNVTRNLELFIEGIKNWGDDLNEFGVGFTGYNESGGFFGNKISLGSEALKLTLMGNEDHIYLIGNIKSEYLGNGWGGNPENEKGYGKYKEYQLDTVEYLYAMYREGILSNNTRVWFVHFRKAAVEYEGIRTSSLFRPAKTITIALQENRGKLVDDTDNVSFNTNQNKKTGYDVEFFTLNRDPDIMSDIIRNLSQYQYSTLSDAEYEEFRNIVEKVYKGVELPYTGDFEAALKQRADYIRGTYVALPESITDRTYALAEQITVGCSTDYDKMMAIVEYLADYTYTTNPGRMPQNQDIVDYFLFDSKEGYCTYFATAAAVLGRCVGIPTRYMQGYLLDAGRTGEYGRYTVTEEQAHAWIECYFEGVGWLTFEATPGNATFLYQDWNVPAYVTGEKEEQEKKPVEITPDEEEEEEPEELTPIEKTEKEEEPEEEEKETINPGIWVVSAIILFIAIWMIYLKLCEIRFWRYYRKASNGEKVRLDVMMTLWIMRKSGHPIRDNETLRRYFVRMKSVYPDKETVLENVCNIYMQLRYGEKREFTKEEQRMAQRLRLNLMDKTVREGAMARQCLKKIKNK